MLVAIWSAISTLSCFLCAISFAFRKTRLHLVYAGWAPSSDSSGRWMERQSHLVLQVVAAKYLGPFEAASGSCLDETCAVAFASVDSWVPCSPLVD